MVDGRAAVVLLPGDIPRIGAADGPHVLRLATSTLTAGSLSLYETGGTAVGSGPPMHIHHRDNEAFYVISGSYRMHVAGRDHVCPAGSFIYLPPGTVHGFYALEAGTRKLNLYAPAAYEGFYEELEEILNADPDDAAVRDLFERYATEIVGPIPDAYYG
jgi:quercetin dioxygenase-like cupin family protein